MDEFGQERSMLAAVAPVPNPSAGPSRRALPLWDQRTWLVATPLALTVIYAFIPALDNGFVDWDDRQNFLENPYFRGLGAAQVKWAWTTFWDGAYQPLAWMVYEAEYVFCKLNPRGYHLTSLLLQVANAVVLYVLTVAMLVRCRTESCLENPWTCPLSAGLATALFAVHPLRVEAVAWVSGQMYLPSILFAMLSVLAYLRAFWTSSSPRWGWLAGSFLLFVTALLFHALPVSLPAVLLILDVYPLRRFPDGSGRWLGASARRALLEKIPFVMTSLFFLGLAIAAKPQSRIPVQHYDASEGIAQACYAIWFYVLKTLLPQDLIAFYPLPRGLNWLAFPYNVSILATLATSSGLFLLRRRWPGLLAAWLSYLVILAPNSGFIRISDQIATDRYSYMSMLGLVTLVAAGFWRLWRTAPHWRPGAIGLIALGLGAVLSLTALTRNQCRTWLNAETLWTHALTHGPNSNHMAHSSLGNVFYKQGKYGEAVAHFTEALRLIPDYDKVHNNFANVLYAQGKYEDAVAHFAEALRLNPHYADAHYNLGVILQAQGRYQAAEAHYAEAVRLRPGYADARKNFGVVLYAQGKYEAAATHFAEALRLNPDYADAHNSLGTILSRERRYGEAQAHFAEAVRLRPDNARAHYNLGIVLSRLGSYEAARAQFAEAIRLDSGFAEAYNASAMIMAACPEAKFRDSKGAVQFATRACELTKWKSPVILDTLAAAEAEAGDFDAAVKWQKRAIELLTDERQKDDYRSRLKLYRAKKRTVRNLHNTP